MCISVKNGITLNGYRILHGRFIDLEDRDDPLSKLLSSGKND